MTNQSSSPDLLQPAGPAPQSTARAISKGVTPPPCTAVLVNLKVKPGIDPRLVMKEMPEEMRATARLYLEGRIQQWYSHGDGRGVVFIFYCASVEETKVLTDQLPLVKTDLVNLEFTPLGPLMPLWFMLDETAAS